MNPKNIKYKSPALPVATIVIPTHNSSSYIESAISSIINSATEYPTEIILIDDASKDIEQLKEIAKTSTNIRIIEKEKKTNAADSRNIGLAASKGEFVFFLDSDDSYTKDHIQRRITLHKKNGHSLIFGSFIERSDGIDSKKNIAHYQLNDIREYIFVENGDVRSSTISICKQIYKGTTFDPAQYKHQDWGFAIRAYNNGEIIFFDNHSNVIIDNTKNISRMSSRMNISASRYFLDRYITNPNHIFSFARAHLKLSIISKDKAGQIFIRSILTPTLHKASPYKKLKIIAICLATLPIFRNAAQLLFFLKH